MPPAALLLVLVGLAAIASLFAWNGAQAAVNPDAPAAPPLDPAGALLDAIGGAVNKITGWAPPDAAAPYLPQISAAEAAHGIPAGLLARQLYQESRYRPDIINGDTASPAGALGIAQFMPATARDLGIDPLDPNAAIDAAGRYMRRLYDSLGSWAEALAAYNWGIGNVKRKGLTAAPEETRNYVDQITADVPVT